MSSFTTEYLVQRFTFDYEDQPAVTVGIVPDVTTSGAVSSVNGETGVVVLSADDVKARDIYAVVLVMSPASVTAFGGSMVNGVSLTIAALAGSIPTGYDILIWNGTAGGAPNGSYTHAGAGVFNYSSRQYLNATSVANGCVKVVGVDYATTGATGGWSDWAITTANGTTFGLTAIGGYAYEVSLDLGQFDTDYLHDYRAHEERLGLVQSPEFRKGAGDAETDGWTSPADDVPTTSYGVLFTGRVDELRGASWFHECMHRGMDGGVGAADSIELAIREWDGATYPTGSDELPPEGALWLYAEGTNQASGEAWESGDPLPETWQINVDADIRLGCWFTVLMWHNLTTGTVTLYREIDYGGVELVGRRWRQVAQLVDLTDAGSVYLDPAEPWAMGVRFQGPWREAEVYIDGALAYAPRASEWVSGLTVTDSEANVWTTTTGTVEPSLDERVDALETAPSTVDVVSNVATARILGRVTSGSGDSEELTAAQARTLLAQPEVLLHSETVASDAAVKSYDVTGWAKIRVEFTGRGTRSGSTVIGLYATLNGNTGNVYSTNAAALTSSLALGNVPGSSTNTNRRGMVNAEIDLTSGAYKEGLAWGTNVGSTATVGQAPANVGLWSTITDAVTSIELKMQLDNIAAGARIRIVGLEAA